MRSSEKGPRKADAGILDHNRKREVEVKVMRLREQLEEKGVPDDEVDARTDELRASLLAKIQNSGGGGGAAGAGRPGETHAKAAAKEAETAALKSALGISEGYVGGSAFDRELQAQMKAERMAKREQAEAERAAAEAELEREREREERRKQKAERKEERAREKEERAREKEERKRARKE